MQEKNELFGRLDKIKKEVTALRDSLNELDQQKESWFQKKEEYGKKIRHLIIQVKEKRNQRDSLTKKVKEDKEKRNSINKKIKDSISEIKNLNEEKSSLTKKRSVNISPSKIKAEIDRLEVKLETEAMSFEKEQGIVKGIKLLKKRFDEAKFLNDVSEKNNDLSREISNFKKESESFHQTIQKTAKESQSVHEELITNSKEIDELRLKEREAFSKFFEFKKKFAEANNALKGKLKDFSDVNSEIHKIKHEKEEKIIRDKEEFIQEKIRKGQKLTNEDLLIFQTAGK